MSTYVSRYIEVKNKEGEWELLSFLFPFGKGYSTKPDVSLEGQDYEKFNCVCNNACSLRGYLASNYFDKCPFDNRGFPTDMSNELQEYFKVTYDTSETDYRYNKSYVMLSELYALYKEKESEWKKRYLEKIKQHEYELFHNKLDRLLDLTMKQFPLDEKENKKTKKIIKDGVENKDDIYSFNEDMEEYEEIYEEIMSIRDEYMFTWKLVDAMYSYKNDDEIRIVYYFE